MKKLTFILSLLVTFVTTAMAQPSKRLTADELNAVTGTQRIAIKCTQKYNNNYNTYFNGTTRTAWSDNPCVFVFEWIRVEGEEDVFYIKNPLADESVAYMQSSKPTNWGALTESPAKFKAVKPFSGGTNQFNFGGADCYETPQAGGDYYVRLCRVKDDGTVDAYFRMNNLDFPGLDATGVWTVQNVYDASDYYLLTLNIQKGGTATTTKTMVKANADIVVPSYDNYISNFADQKMPAEDYTITVTYTYDYSNFAISHGKVYRFDNVGNSGQSLAAASTLKSVIKPSDSGSKAQLWYAEQHPKGDGSWTLRNLGNGKYLQHTGQGTFWGFVDDASSATELYLVSPADGVYTFNSANNTGGYTCMHWSESQGGVVGWTSGANASKWTITSVDMTAEELAANWEELDELYSSVNSSNVSSCQTHLDNLFSDKACTTPKKNLTAGTIVNDADYLALPAGLQEMAKKVYANDWSEENSVDGKDGWDSDYAKKFRVQMYEPYSIAGDITSFLGINAHNNMDNPTGLVGNERDVIYVMVEGEIKQGAKLYLYAINGHAQMGQYDDENAVELHEGLNAVPYYSDGNALWINYVVDTYNNDTKTVQNQLSGYEPLKIHIAGGSINGYYNACGDALWGDPDDDNDWEYMKERASHESFTVLGHRVVLHFYLNDIVVDGKTHDGMYDLLSNISVPETPKCFSGTVGGTPSYAQYEGMGLNTSTGKINIMLEAWDRIAYSQHLTMGLLSESDVNAMNAKYPRWNADYTMPGSVYTYGKDLNGDGIDDNSKSYKDFCNGRDYSEYYNHHCLAISRTSGNMSGGWQSSNYPINTARSIIGKLANEAGPTWGPAHEIGHQHQALFTLNGLTEVTNNLFANISVWYMGIGTSRFNGSEGSLESVLSAFNTPQSDFYTNNIWALTHMYYRLWLYYHLCGNNTQFYPRLFELLRHEPLEKNYNQGGPEGLLRFYRLCCYAAEEDLTEFFRAHGLLEVMDNRFVGDYSNSVYTQTQAEIDAAIADVKSKGYPVNYAPLFISDATKDVTRSHDGTTNRVFWDAATGEGKNAEMGSYIDFISGEAAGVSEFTCDGSKVTATNASGVGIIILNGDGEIVGFSTKREFEISEKAQEAILSGEVTFATVAADGGTVEAAVDLTAMRRQSLEAYLAKVQSEYLAYADDNYVGWYKTEATTDLQKVYDDATAALENGNVDTYVTYYNLLEDEVAELEANSHAKVAFSAAHTYQFVNKSYPTHSMYMNGTNVQATTGSTNVKWVFEASSTNGAYYIKNAEAGTYIGNVSQSTQVTSTGTGENAYKLAPINNYYWTMKHVDDGDKQHLHCDSEKKIVGWSATDASQWALKIVEANDVALKTDELETLIAQTEALLDEVTYTEKIALQCTDPSGAYYINCPQEHNAINPNEKDGQGIAGLIDGDGNTFMHTAYQNMPAGPHYIQVDMGEGNTIESFVLEYVTRSGASVDFPTEITIKGSNNNENYAEITVLSDLQTGAAVTNVREILNDVPYRYLRFEVTATTSNRTYFHMAEFSLTEINIVDEYSPEVTTTLVNAAKEEIATAENVVSTATTTGDIETALTALQKDYDALQKAINTVKTESLKAAKAILKQIIDATDVLINNVGTITHEYSANTISANTYQISSNAGQNNADGNVGGKNDGLGIPGLSDTDPSTYFHSRWGGTAVNEPHYLQIDLGQGNELDNFLFEYCTRKASNATNTSPAPTKIEVYAGNDTGNLTLLKTLTQADDDLPSYENLGASWRSDMFTITGSPVRYIRLTVTKSDGPGNEVWNEQYFFAMGGLSIMHNTILNSSVSVKDGVETGILTSELLTSSYAKLQAAQAVYYNATTAEQLSAAAEELNAVYNELTEAMNGKNTALEAARDELLATINSTNALIDKAGNSEYVAMAISAPLLAASVEKDAAQAVYDTATDVGAVEEATRTLKRKRSALEDAMKFENSSVIRTISAGDSITENWNTPVWKKFINVSADKYQGIIAAYENQYSENANGSAVNLFGAVVNITEPGLLTATYDYKGGNNRLDILGVDLVDSDGNVVASDYHFGYSGNADYQNVYEFTVENAGVYTLRYINTNQREKNTSNGNIGIVYSKVYDKFKAMYDKAADVHTKNAGKTTVGYYTSESADELQELVDDYSGYTASSSVSELYDAYVALKTQIGGMEYIAPEVGKFYTIRSNYIANHHIFANETNAAKYGNTYSDNTAKSRYIWQFEDAGNGEYKLKNLHTDSYLAIGGSVSLNNEGGKFTVNYKFHEVPGTVYITSGTNSLHCNDGQGAEKKLIGWHTGAGNNVFIEEVSLDAVSPFTLKISSAGWSSLYLNYAVEIPKGVNAYIITGRGDSYVNLQSLEGVIPEKTAVLVSGAENNYALEYTESDSDIEGNMLEGTLWTSYIEALDDYKYYVLALKNGAPGMYQIYKEYDEHGKTTGKGYDSGTHFKNGANKVYLPIKANTLINGFSFRILDGTTGIDGVDYENYNDEIIFDLQGRRLDKISEPGIYIVNGKKVYVK